VMQKPAPQKVQRPTHVQRPSVQKPVQRPSTVQRPVQQKPQRPSNVQRPSTVQRDPGQRPQQNRPSNPRPAVVN
jgi:hypothetical protein